jgi:hypothetical protein
MEAERPHPTLENTFHRNVKDQLIRSVAHGVIGRERLHKETSQFITSASTVGPSTVTGV